MTPEMANVERCAGCHRPIATSDCGCPAGTYMMNDADRDAAEYWQDRALIAEQQLQEAQQHINILEDGIAEEAQKDGGIIKDLEDKLQEAQQKIKELENKIIMLWSALAGK